MPLVTALIVEYGVHVGWYDGLDVYRYAGSYWALDGDVPFRVSSKNVELVEDVAAIYANMLDDSH